MKSLALALLLIFPVFASPQGVFTNQTNAALQKVIGDYPNHFKNIKGNVIYEDLQSTNYSSNVQIPGSLNTVLTRYNSSADKEVYSWKCILDESDDFERVSRKYKDLYNQIRNSIIKIGEKKPFILNGTYEAPTEEKKFVTSAFYLLPSTDDMGKLRVELTLEYYVTEWKLALLVYNQEENTVVKQ